MSELISSGEWYHGSPEELSTIRTGSTITQDRDLARVFSHKPQLVSQGYEGRYRSLRHSGVRFGFLYRIAETVKESDVRPHPTTTMGPGQEWLTTRELRVELIEPTVPRPEEALSEADVSRLLSERGNVDR